MNIEQKESSTLPCSIVRSYAIYNLKELLKFNSLVIHDQKLYFDFV